MTEELGFDSWQGQQIFSSAKYLDWLWVSPTLPSNAYWGFSPGLSAWGLNLITHLHPAMTLRMIELFLHFPIYFDGIVLNYAQGQLYLYV
jgi:hypothetical protein